MVIRKIVRMSFMILMKSDITSINHVSVGEEKCLNV